MRLHKILLSTILVTLCAVACSENPAVETTPPHSEGRITLTISSESPLLEVDEQSDTASINFKSRGGELLIDVVTNVDEWQFTSHDAEWLTLSRDEYALTISAEANTSEVERKAQVVITAEEGEWTKSITLDISQRHSGMAEISLLSDSHNFKAHTELETIIGVDTNVDEWSFASSCSWLFVERCDEGLRLVADDNATNSQRETKVQVFAGLNAEDSDSIVVSQDGSAFVVLSSHNVTADDTGGRRELAIESNPELNWSVENCVGDWFTATPEQGCVVVEILANAEGNERTGSFEVVVGEEDNRATAKVSVRQIGPDTEELIYEVEISEPDYQITAAPVLSTGGGGAISVDWGDGSPMEEFVERRGTHIYHTPGIYTITITGEARSLEFSDGKTENTELRNIISWGKLGYTSAVDMCLGCTRLESIPNDVAGSFSGVKSFLGAFSCCVSLKEIPAGLFRYATSAKNFEDCFSHSASISEIPAGLFDNCTVAQDFSYTFYATGTGIVITNNTLSNFSEVKSQVLEGRLKSIPEGLFKSCKNADDFDYTFGATAIESIPEDIFATNSIATAFTGAFSACVCLQSIPEKLMEGAVGALDIKYMFAGCDSLVEIPVGMFKTNSAVTNLEYIFYRTGVRDLKRGIFEGLSSVKTVGAVFQSCESLTTLDDSLFEGLVAAKSFRYCFADCTSLRTLPEGLFNGMSNAYEFTYTFHNTALEQVPAHLFAEVRDYSSADFTYMFSDCSNLRTVPATLFERFTKVTSPGYRNLFDNSGIETIPAGLFVNSVAVSTGFESLFENCPKLKSIEGSIFPETTTISSIAYMFTNCPSLESIPADLFVPFGESKLKFTATFAGCTSLKSIPDGLFRANIKAKQFSETFADCTSLESIPADLLTSCVDITTVKGLFFGCTSLKSIPEGLFRTNSAITSFERTFAECSSLESIPADIFSAIGTKTSSITFSECFIDCTSLKSLPATMFDTVRRINYIDGCFDGCSALTGESPYTIITNEDGTTTKVHLYERERGTEFLIVPSSTSAHADCFAGCKGLDDYQDMPSSWR